MWKAVKLGDVCDFQGGSQPPKKEFVFEPQEGYVRFLQIRDFKSDKNVTYIPIAKKNRLCNTDDILIGRYGASVGQILRGLGGAYNVALMKTIPNEELISKGWLYAYLNSPLFQKPLMEVSSRSAQNGFSKDDISNFELPLPPLAEQQRIVAKLDAAFAEIDRAIELSKEKAKQAERLVQNAIREKTLTIMRQHGSKSLAELCDLQNGFAFKSTKFRDSGTPVLRISNIQDGSITTEKLVYASQDDYAENLDKYIVTKDALLIAMSGATTGKVGKQKSEQDFYLNQRVGMLKPKANLDRDFLYFFLSTKVEELLSISAGAAQPNLSTKQIKEIQLPNATLGEQRDFSRALSRLSAEIDSLLSLSERTLSNLAALKSAILAQELQPPQSEAA